jgi:hypothetical protein
MLGFGAGRQKMALNDGQIPNVRGVRAHVSTGYNRGEGNRRASRNGLVSDLHRKSLTLHFRNFVHCCITRLLDCQPVNRYSLLLSLTFSLSDCSLCELPFAFYLDTLFTRQGDASRGHLTYEAQARERGHPQALHACRFIRRVLVPRGSLTQSNPSPSPSP